MSFTPNFSCSQSSGLPGTIITTDISTGSDSNITKRRLFFLQADGTYLVPSGDSNNYIDWALINSSISENLLTQDTALLVTVQWLDNANTVLYSKPIAYGFDAFGQTFFYGLSDGQVPIQAAPVVLSTNYYQNKVKFFCFLTSAAQAITYASDIYKAQIAYDLDQWMITNQNDFF